MSKRDRATYPWAELRPAATGSPKWKVLGKGNDLQENVEFPAVAWPPGTKVFVVEPVCPTCEMPRRLNPDPDAKGRFRPKCDCGFDWQAWERKLRRGVPA